MSLEAKKVEEITGDEVMSNKTTKLDIIKSFLKETIYHKIKATAEPEHPYSIKLGGEREHTTLKELRKLIEEFDETKLFKVEDLSFPEFEGWIVRATSPEKALNKIMKGLKQDFGEALADYEVKQETTASSEAYKTITFQLEPEKVSSHTERYELHSSLMGDPIW